MGLTREQLIRLGAGVERFLNDESVQQVWEALEEIYYKQWKAAKSAEERELMWAKVSAIGDLREKLETAVAVGQDEAYRLELEEAADAKPGHQH